MANWFYSSIFYRIWKRILTWFGDIYFATELPKTKAKQIRKMLALGAAGINIIPKEKIIYADDLILSCENIYEDE